MRYGPGELVEGEVEHPQARQLAQGRGQGAGQALVRQVQHAQPREARQVRGQPQPRVALEAEVADDEHVLHAVAHQARRHLPAQIVLLQLQRRTAARVSPRPRYATTTATALCCPFLTSSFSSFCSRSMPEGMGPVSLLCAREMCSRCSKLHRLAGTAPVNCKQNETSQLSPISTTSGISSRSDVDAGSTLLWLRSRMRRCSIWCTSGSGP